jgi:predicted homoserine dehydrogenase-like protein
MKGIPMGIAPGAKILKDIKIGMPLTEENTSPDSSQFVYQLRKMQDDMLQREEHFNR